MSKVSRKVDKRVFLVAQEIELAKLLAGNNVAARKKALHNLQKWITNRSKAMSFTENDYERLWTGLFFSMWNSDKPLAQEECAENIANLVHLTTLDDSLVFFKTGLIVLNAEWFGIDQLRLDKFLMLVRRLLRHTLMVLKEHGFHKDVIEKFNNVLRETVLSPDEVHLGLALHFIEVFMEELAKVSQGKIHADRVVKILEPFIEKLAITSDGRGIACIQKFIFTYLIIQSDSGLEYQAKYNAWKQLGFPGSIDSMQKVKVDQDGNNSSDEGDITEDQGQEKTLDPRAGRIDVEIPQIKFNAKLLSQTLLNDRFAKGTNTKSRKVLTMLSKQFKDLADHVYPLGIHKIEAKGDDCNINVRKAANRLIKFEQKILGKGTKRKRNGENADESHIEGKRKRTVTDKNYLSGETMKTSKTKSRKVETLSANVDAENANNVNNLRNASAKQVTILGKKNVTNTMVPAIKKAKDKIKRTKKRTVTINNIECIFERNSGTWVVFNTSNEVNNDRPSKTGNLKKLHVALTSSKTPLPVTQAPKKNLITPSYESSLGNAKGSITPSRRSRRNSIRVKVSLNDPDGNTGDKLLKDIRDVPQSPGINSKILFGSPAKNSEIFPKSEWDEQTTEDEPKVLNTPKRKLQIVKELSQKKKESPQKIKGKSRRSLNASLINIKNNVTKNSMLSLDFSLLKNYFSPSSTKRVKINTKLNTSQEIHEHQKQILTSPGIPYDANKKPSKPLLKTPTRITPINPFYNC